MQRQGCANEKVYIILELGSVESGVSRFAFMVPVCYNGI